MYNICKIVIKIFTIFSKGIYMYKAVNNNEYAVTHQINTLSAPRTTKVDALHRSTSK